MVVSKERKKLAGFTLEGDLLRKTIPLDQIVLPEYQPRAYFDEKQLEQLTQSIREHGILEPLIVRPKPFSNLYELVAGGRRYHASKLALLQEAPVVIKELNDTEVLEIALLENLQREDLNPLEETEGILRLLSSRLAISVEEIPALLYKLNRQQQGQIKSDNNVIIEQTVETIHQVFYTLGKLTVQSFIQNRLPLLNLPNEILQALKEGKIAYTKARAIAKIEDENKRIELLNEAITEKLSLSQIKVKIKQISQTTNNQDSISISIIERTKTAFKKIEKTKILEDSKKKKKFEKLLEQLEALLET